VRRRDLLIARTEMFTQGRRRSRLVPMTIRSRILAGVIAVAAVSGRAAAAGPDVALTELDFEGVAADDQAKVRRAIIAAVGERLLPIAVADPSPDAHVEHLSDDRSRIEMGKHFAARLLMELTVTTRQSASRSAWSLSGTVFDTEGAELLGSEESKCEGCNVDEAVHRAGALVQKLLARDQHRPTGRLTVRMPAGVAVARITIDGRPMGYLPFDETVFAGNHNVGVEADAYRRYFSTVQLESGATVHVQPVLERGHEPVAAAPRSPALRIVGATLIPAGAVGIIAGAVLLSMNGDAACSIAPGMTRCPSRYNNTGVGAALVSVGAVAAIGGAVVLALDAVQRRRASSMSTMPTMSTMRAFVDLNGAGVLVGAQGRF
jgi:hypothetical protein